jgi:hypothetical protein
MTRVRISSSYIFWEEGTHRLSTRWIGGRDLKETLESALDRSRTWAGSSRGWGYSASREYGLLSPIEENNPHFHNWNAIILNYCDGTGLAPYCNE